MNRGRLILIEGLDRTGKTTQTTLLLGKLEPNSVLIKFPDRSTKIGQLINEYLNNDGLKLSDQAVHLLFSANRWEVAEKIKTFLLDGINVILDRYVYSGVAYSAAKKIPSMDMTWCLYPDKGLLKPDLTIFFMNQNLDVINRQGFGEERYEKVEFQSNVRATFLDIFEHEDSHYKKNCLKIINISRKSIEQVSSEVWEIVEPIINTKNDDSTLMYF